MLCFYFWYNRWRPGSFWNLTNEEVKNLDKKKWIIIDGNSLIYRTFYALPPLTNSKGIHTNAVYGFANILLKIIQEEKPKYMGVAFDERTPTFRHKDFTDYKAGRLRMPEELISQFPILFEMLESLGIKRISLEGYEADDLIGTLSKIGEDLGMEVKILTGDRDAFQLASEKVSIWYTKRGVSDIDDINPQVILERYGVTPGELIDVKAFMGDKSDNIPGIPGIGEKTALSLIKEYKSLEGVYNNIDKINRKTLKERLLSYKEDAVLSKKLATIVRDIPLEIDIEDFILDNPFNERLLSLFRDLEFNSLLDRLASEDGRMDEKGMEELNFETIEDLEQLRILIHRIGKEKYVYIHWALEGKGQRRKELQCLVLGFKKGDLCYVDLDRLDVELVLAELRGIFEESTIGKAGHNLKELLVFLFHHDIQLEGIDFDTYISAYILEPSESKYDLPLLTAKYLGGKIPSDEEILGKGKQKKAYSQLDSEERTTFMMHHLNSIIKLHNRMHQDILKNQMESLYYEIELPLIYVLAEMEYTGFHVEKSELERLSQEFGERIDKLTHEIHTLAGQGFNINSPKQLGQVLFEHLKLPIIKRTKTGYSTDIEVLERLRGKHPIIEKIIEIRQITKLKSTYIDGFMTIIDEETGNIHSSFNQAITSTGRISSSEPNLQNIPIKMEMGRRIRKVFVPRNPQDFLVDADYSQIELRILAHFSGDEKLIEAFNSDQDIHQQPLPKFLR